MSEPKSNRINEAPLANNGGDEKSEEAIDSRKMRPTGSVHFGDADFEVPEEYADATWKEVFDACCIKSPEEWGMTFVGICLALFFLYFFLFGLELMGSAAKVMTGCRAGSMFGDDMNPVAGVMVGIIATVLFQSSSTTTSIVISLTGSGITVKQGIYMVMGSNIGTSVTNTIIAMGQMGDGDQLERAFGGAVVHDMFNFLTVAILLPFEAITGYLFHLTKACVRNANTSKGDSWTGPIKQYVSPLSNKIIRSNSSLLRAIAQGTGSCEDGGGFYPILCEPGVVPTPETCPRVGLINCNKDENTCPAFFQPQATANDDKVSGGVVFFISIIILFVCLIGLVTILQKMLLGMSTRIIYKATNINGYLAIAIGAGITLLVQSSSITTSTLTPLVGLGALRLEQMYPLSLGANLGTTVTGLMAAMVTEGTSSLQVALAHLFFNVTGIVIWYPVPYMRNIPIYSARQLGKGTRLWRGFPVLYIAIMFFLVPLIFLGISYMFEKDTKGMNVLGSFVTILLALGLMWLAYYWKYKNGKEKCIECFETREKKRMVMQNLPEDMQYLKARVAALSEHTGLPDEEENMLPEDKEKEAIETNNSDCADAEIEA